MIGCSSSSLTVGVKDKESGMPLERIRIERNCPASTTDKLLNPVGSSYHPLKLIESKITDKNGEGTFGKTTDKDVYRIYRDDPRPIVVTALGKQIELSPATNQVSNGKWGYAVWMEGTALKRSAWPVKDYAGSETSR